MAAALKRPRPLGESEGGPYTARGQVLTGPPLGHSHHPPYLHPFYFKTGVLPGCGVCYLHSPYLEASPHLLGGISHVLQPTSCSPTDIQHEPKPQRTTSTPSIFQPYPLQPRWARQSPAGVPSYILLARKMKAHSAASPLSVSLNMSHPHTAVPMWLQHLRLPTNFCLVFKIQLRLPPTPRLPWPALLHAPVPMLPLSNNFHSIL